MPSPSDRLYSSTHEWHQTGEGGKTLTLGLTKFAVDQLTDVTYVDMKPAGHKFKAGDSIGVVESVKTTSDVYCAAGGEVTEVNAALAGDPGLLNSDPYGKGWLVRIRVADGSGLDTLMKAAAYDAEHPA